MRGRGGHWTGSAAAAVAALSLSLPVAPVRAQTPGFAPPTSRFTTTTGGPTGGGASMLPPGGGLGAPSPTTQTLAPPVQGPSSSAALSPSSGIPAGQVALALSARYGRETPQTIGAGLVWRIYPAKPDRSGSFRPLKEEKQAAPVLALPPGDYVVHVTLGLASAVKTVHLKPGEITREVFDLPAGAIRIEGRVGDVPITPGQITFQVYRGSRFETDDKRPIAENIGSGDVLVVPDGMYSIVSNYGDSNSVVRSDIRVQPGKLTDVSVTHRAAVIVLKLVGDRGGEALANTSWSVLTPGGDVVKESVGAFPKFVLAEGEYRAVARNEDRNYERQFKVITGVDGEVEVLAR